jgi:RNA polymerase sigma factor (sigma-70 family)
MIPDGQLLQGYAEQGAEEMFAEIVRRHLPFVYAAALRQTNGAVHRAEDVTQLVFIELARNARALGRRDEIIGWLYTTTHYTAAKLKRTELRRQNREQEAFIMQQASSASDHVNWEQLRPVLDEAMHELPARDRELILMRFFQMRRLADLGRALALSEDAARMRLERALQKLRAALARREITSTTAALATVLANQPPVVAATSLAQTVTSAAVSAGNAATLGWSSLFTMSKLPLGIAGAVAIAASIGLIVQSNSVAALRAEAASLRRGTASLASTRDENLRLTRLAAEVAAMRQDDEKLTTLNAEASELRTRLEEIARTERARATQSNAPDLSRLDLLPRPTFRMRPDFPSELQTHGIGGEVSVDFTIDADGVVQEARITPGGKEAGAPSGVVQLEHFVVAVTTKVDPAAKSPAPRPDEPMIQRLLEAAALEAVTGWKFEGGRKGGRAVNTRLQVRMVFTVVPEIPASATR